MSKTNPATQDPTKSEEEIPGPSSRTSEPEQNALPNITVEHILDAPKMWANSSLLPAYFVTLEKYFVSRNVTDENARFVSLSNVMSSKQIETHSFSLSRAADSNEPYTTLKDLILSSVAEVCKTDWIDALSEIQYNGSHEKPSDLMSRLIAICRNKPENDQGTRDIIERTFIRLQPENIQNILKAQTFDSLHDLGTFTNRFHGQINLNNLNENETTKQNFEHLTNKIDELYTEIHHVKQQSQNHQKFPHHTLKNQPRKNFWQNRPFRNQQSNYQQNYQKSNQTRPFNQSGFCFYHSKFGNKAIKCSKPCTFQPFKNQSVSAIHHSKTVSLNPEISLPKVYDKLSKKLFLIDSGACASFLPATNSNNTGETPSLFVDASGKPVKCFGSTPFEIDIGFGRMTAVFHICAIEQPILGYDFLKSNRITLDASTNTLKCDNSVNKISTLQASINSFDGFPAHESRYTKLLQNYPELTSPLDYRKPVKHNIVHHLPTKGRPPNIKTRRVSPEKYKQIKQQIEEMLASGLIIPSNSEFGSPLHVVPKANSKELRMVGDYKILNKMLTPDRYPLPIFALLMNFYMARKFSQQSILNPLFIMNQ